MKHLQDRYNSFIENNGYNHRVAIVLDGELPEIDYRTTIVLFYTDSNDTWYADGLEQVDRLLGGYGGGSLTAVNASVTVLNVVDNIGCYFEDIAFRADGTDYLDCRAIILRFNTPEDMTLFSLKYQINRYTVPSYSQ